MKVIVAGSRDVTDYNLVKETIESTLKVYGIEITELVHGGARGVDELAKRWADKRGILAVEFPAHWNDLNVKDTLIKTNRFGKKYNALAGFNRNKRMAEYANVLIALRKNNSPGTTHMIETAGEMGLQVFVKEL